MCGLVTWIWVQLCQHLCLVNQKCIVFHTFHRSLQSYMLAPTWVVFLTKEDWFMWILRCWNFGNLKINRFIKLIWSSYSIWKERERERERLKLIRLWLCSHRLYLWSCYYDEVLKASSFYALSLIRRPCTCMHSFLRFAMIRPMHP